MSFKKYQKKTVTEMRPVTEEDINLFKDNRFYGLEQRFSVSQTDEEAGSPKIGDMIASNPDNREDQWLVAQKYFENNFTEFVEQK